VHPGAQSRQRPQHRASIRAPLNPIAFDRATLDKIRWSRRQLLAWYADQGRQFSWRSSSAGIYQKLVAEILLQRTQAATVHRFFPIFFEQFSSWNDIHSTPVTKLGHALRPIGLWRRRSVALKALAAEMVRRGGMFPQLRDELETLPAVGQYVANAVLLFAHHRPEPLLDANMARVLERVFKPRRLADIRYDPWLQALARRFVRSRRSIEINWAVLDVAALYCRPAKPTCANCPLRKRCNYALRVTEAS
jgi:A/G-specific adenine glycosylase